MPMEMLLPPGYLSLSSMARVMGAKTNLESDMTIEQAMELGMIVCGSAATVRDKLRDYRATMGFGNLLTMLQFGTMPGGASTAQNQRRFAEGVIKPLRAEAAAMAAR